MKRIREDEGACYATAGSEETKAEQRLPRNRWWRQGGDTRGEDRDEMASEERNRGWLREVRVRFRHLSVSL